MKRRTKIKLSLGAAGVGLGGLLLVGLRRASAASPTYPILTKYPPGSPEMIALFEAAARVARLPIEWARSQALWNLIDHESDGRVGIKNPTSSATGIGQLIIANVRKYYPSGEAGIGDPLEEAVGMLRYIAFNEHPHYGSPEVAWAQYHHADGRNWY